MFAVKENLVAMMWLGTFMFLGSMLVLFLPLVGLAQGPPETERKVIQHNDKLFTEEYGKLLGSESKMLFERRYQRPIGTLKVRGIKWEEIPLTATLDIGVKKGTVQVDKAMRITVFSELDPGASTIWIGDQRLASQTGGTGFITFLVYGRWQFEDGAEIKIAKGGYCGGDDDPRTVLPDKLVVPEEYKMALPKKPENYIESIHTFINQDTGAFGVAHPILVKFHFVTAFHRTLTNNIWMLQIGDEEFAEGGGNMEKDSLYDPRMTEGRASDVIMTKQQFDKLEHGRPIYLNFGECSNSGTFLGRLDKTMLDRQR